MSLFHRADWTLFRNLNTISQKSGVAIKHLRRLVYKELADNALDATHEKCKIWTDSDGVYHVEDNGLGLNMKPKEIAELFSINRPLTSSKILRLPTRGALGNGLRVVTGAAMASGGWLKVETNGLAIDLGFDETTGKCIVTRRGKSAVKGTRVSVLLGTSVPHDKHEDLWAAQANAMHSHEPYTGKSSCWWYDSDAFYELLQAAGTKATSWLVSQFDGIKKDRLSKLLMNLSTVCNNLSREEAEQLMMRMRLDVPKRPSPKKIGSINYQVKTYGEITLSPGRGDHSAILPFCVSAHASPRNDNPADDKEQGHDTDIIEVFVNGTPITGDVDAQRRAPTQVAFFGCGLAHRVKNVSRRLFHVWVNVTIPYMPITTDGKSPNLEPMIPEIGEAIRKATGALKSSLKKTSSGGLSQRDIILDNLQEGVASASGDGVYRYSIRQLYYAIRPFVLQSEITSLDYGHFSRVIGEYEDRHGPLNGIYRDPRGTLYHPHLRRSIPIGTLAVEKYERPEWTFNKILYCEKEGFFAVLQQLNWPERHDCALLSSKGFASRAVRDVLDLLGDTGEEIQFFCIHDADASGTLIYQALTEKTGAREARRVKIHNLGLEPWEAKKMDLQLEDFEAKKASLPYAQYVKDYDDDHDTQWGDWLQNKRVELNAMTSPQFVAWLDKVIAPFSTGKIIPPDEVLHKELKGKVDVHVRDHLTQDILAEAKFEDQVATRMKKFPEKVPELRERVSSLLLKEPTNRWDVPVDVIADEIAVELNKKKTKGVASGHIKTRVRVDGRSPAARDRKQGRKGRPR